MLKKIDKKIIAVITLIVILVSLGTTAFAASDYYSWFSIFGGNTLTGPSRTYTGSTIGIDFSATISGSSSEGCNYIECYEYYSLFATNLGTRSIYDPTYVSQTWNMLRSGDSFYFWFWNTYTGTWASTGGTSGVHMYSR